MANEIGVGFQPTSRSGARPPGDLAAILTNLERGRRAVRRRDPPDAARGRGGPVSGARGLQARRGARQGPDARAASGSTCRGSRWSAATTRPGRITLPLRERFGFSPRLDYYSVDDLGRDRAAARPGSSASRSTRRAPTRSRALPRDPADREPAAAPRPRLRGGPARRRDHRRHRPRGPRAVRGRRGGPGQARPRDPVRDRRRSSAGGRWGSPRCAASVGEETDTIEDVVEPYLLQLGFLQRTPRGRVATERAYRAPGRDRAGRLPLLTPDPATAAVDVRVPTARHPDGRLPPCSRSSPKTQQNAEARSSVSLRPDPDRRRVLLPADPSAAEARQRRSRPSSRSVEVGDEVLTTGGDLRHDRRHRRRRPTRSPSRSRPAPRSGWSRRASRVASPRTTTYEDDDEDERRRVRRARARPSRRERRPGDRRASVRARPARRARRAMASVTLEHVQGIRSSRSFIAAADRVMEAMGYTEHGFRHANLVARIAYQVLARLGFDEREANLACVAGYLHDVGNMLARDAHGQTGAILVYQALRDRGGRRRPRRRSWPRSRTTRRTEGYGGLAGLGGGDPGGQVGRAPQPGPQVRADRVRHPRPRELRRRTVVPAGRLRRPNRSASS